MNSNPQQSSNQPSDQEKVGIYAVKYLELQMKELQMKLKKAVGDVEYYRKKADEESDFKRKGWRREEKIKWEKNKEIKQLKKQLNPPNKIIKNFLNKHCKLSKEKRIILLKYNCYLRTKKISDEFDELWEFLQWRGDYCDEEIKKHIKFNKDGTIRKTNKRKRIEVSEEDSCY